ncbi:hypothetical protein P7C70_g885, partial [Phenoliferia sp. Uapishka_3]
MRGQLEYPLPELLPPLLSSQPSSTGSTIIASSQPSTDDDMSYEALSDQELFRVLEGRYSRITDSNVLDAIGYAHKSIRLAYISGDFKAVRGHGAFIASRCRWLAGRVEVRLDRAEGVKVETVPEVPQVKRRRSASGQTKSINKPLSRQGTWSWREDELCGQPADAPYLRIGPHHPPTWTGVESSPPRDGSYPPLAAPAGGAVCRCKPSPARLVFCVGTDQYILNFLSSPPGTATSEENVIARRFCDSDLPFSECKAFFGIE